VDGGNGEIEYLRILIDYKKTVDILNAKCNLDTYLGTNNITVKLQHIFSAVQLSKAHDKVILKILAVQIDFQKPA